MPSEMLPLQRNDGPFHRRNRKSGRHYATRATVDKEFPNNRSFILRKGRAKLSFRFLILHPSVVNPRKTKESEGAAEAIDLRLLGQVQDTFCNFASARSECLLNIKRFERQHIVHRFHTADIQCPLGNSESFQVLCAYSFFYWPVKSHICKSKNAFKDF
jgi:hypothetical protein